MGLRAKLLQVVLNDLPSSDSVLTEPSSRWDELLGGRKSQDSWGRYGRGYGTTCAIVANGWALDAGLPEDMVINVDTPSGGGSKIFQALDAGAKARGWLRYPKRGELPDLRPGDVYIINHQTSDGSDGSHIGVVVRVTPKGDALEVETADGGQGTRQAQSAARNVRTFSTSSGAHPVVVQSPSGPGWLERWIAVGGDEADDVAGDEGDGGIARPLSSGTAVAIGLGVAGLAFLLLGLTLRTGPNGLFALHEAVDREVARW